MAVPRSRFSAGILLYRRVSGAGSTSEVEVLLGHMGGPFWRRKDARAWTIPKGEHELDEDPLAAAKREFLEEIGMPVPATVFVPLGSVKQSGGKIVTVWAARGDLDASATVSGTFSIEWPPRSGVQQEFPELDRTAWLTLHQARELVVKAQTVFFDRLVAALAETGADPPAIPAPPAG